MATMEEVAEWMHGEMQTNVRSWTARQMRRNWSVTPSVDVRGPALTWGMRGLTFHPPSVDVDVPNPAQAMLDWKNMVGTGKPWDHKAAIRKAFGDWADDGASGLRYRFDIWSNVHYGFVGRFIGFSAWLLKAGAGYAQVAAGTVTEGYWSRRFETLGDGDFMAAFDDPLDQAALMVGVDLWDNNRKATTVAQFVAMMRARAGSLATEAIP